MDQQEVALPLHGSLHVRLPGGRTMRLFAMGDDTYTCVDVWTTRGNAVEDISQYTGDTSRAPMGAFGWKGGGRLTFNTDADPCSHKWPAVATVSLLWDN